MVTGHGDGGAAGAGKRRVEGLRDGHTVLGMETVTITSKFQVMIPQRIRESMRLRSGPKARVLCFRDRIEIIPIRGVRSLRGYLKGIDTKVVREGDRL